MTEHDPLFEAASALTDDEIPTFVDEVGELAERIDTALANGERHRDGVSGLVYAEATRRLAAKPDSPIAEAWRRLHLATAARQYDREIGTWLRA